VSAVPEPKLAAVEDLGVPFLDLRPSHDGLREAFLRDVAELLETNAYTNGPAVAEFERAFAEFCGARHCIGVASGLDALRLALLAAGVEPGDEVIVPAQTFVATLEAVTQVGARPVVVDVREDDYGLDPDKTVNALGPRTRALMPVHLYGQMADLERLLDVASEHDLAVVEDACQAHGATRGELGAGTAGVAGAFSFYPGKNLGAFGDAGALVTDDGRVALRVRALREHGQTRKYEHEWEGYTARLDTIQAAVLLRKLARLADWNDSRRDAAELYTAALEGVGDLRLPQVPAGSRPVWHLYVVRTADPAGLAEFLSERGIGTGRHYPCPVHLANAYAWLGYGPGDFPVAEALAAECLSLPIFPGISERQVETVVDAIDGYFARG
jgi:dTDP-4-amino-4,6-dideoxygalactose transaminase